MISNSHESEIRAKCCDRITPAERSVREYLDSFLKEPPLNSKNIHPDNSSCFDLSKLNNTLPPHDVGMATSSFGRISCCKSSQSLYCKECFRLLVPEKSLPAPVSRRKRLISENNKLDEHFLEGRPLKLPFNLHIVLDDRRGSATGLHAVALLNEQGGSGGKRVGRNSHEYQDSSQTDLNAHNSNNTNSSDDSFQLGSVKLIDLANEDKIPRYRLDDATTFLLFPSPGESVPLESVAAEVKTLVVLDCKWTKNKRFFRKNEELSILQKVHLSSPPQKSYYWRWHNAGPGMISTIEAIFFAAFEVSQHRYKHLLESNQTSHMSSDDQLVDQNNLIHLLWLFGHQRAVTLKAAQKEGVVAPGSEEEKERQREMKKQKGTWRQLRHKEDERRLRERNRMKEEKKDSSV